MLVHRFLEHSAQRTPERVALIELRRTATYGELDGLANRYAHVLLRGGVKRGDRVVIALENCVDMAAAYFGAMKAGAASVPLPPGPRSDRLAKAVADCSPAACVVDPPTAAEAVNGHPLGAVPRLYVWRRDPSSLRPPETLGLPLAAELAAAPDTPVGVRSIDLDLAAIIYTSGSTGEPRGVMLTHRNIVANSRSILSYLHLTAADRVMCVLPFYYVYGLSLLHTHVAVGGSVVIDNRFTFPNVVLDAMREHRVTGFAGVPSTFALLLHRSNITEMTFPELRYATQAGGGMPAPRILEWLERGPKADFYVMYGATEASARLTYLAPSDLRAKLGSIGRPILDVEIKVIRDDGEPAAPGEIGELVARGTNVSPGYWNNPEETELKFGPLGYRTGDLGYADDDGYLYLVGRRHDMIKVGAHRVGAKEIEDVLHEHSAVHEVAVIGVADNILGEVPIAVVALREEMPNASEALRAFCSARLAPHKVPAGVVVRPELPKIGSIGKVDKRALRQELEAERAASVTQSMEDATHLGVPRKELESLTCRSSPKSNHRD